MEQREIKFRAWDNVDKKWLLGYEYPNLGGFSMLGECMLFGEWSNVIGRFILQQTDRVPRDLILMQYIGLKDKNGKEVYEGDVVQLYYRGMKPEEAGSEFIKTSISWNANRLEWGLSGGMAGLFESAFELIDEDFEVIGNIYQHPWLLQSETANETK